MPTQNMVAFGHRGSLGFHGCRIQCLYGLIRAPDLSGFGLSGMTHQREDTRNPSSGVFTLRQTFGQPLESVEMTIEYAYVRDLCVYVCVRSYVFPCPVCMLFKI